VRSPRHGRSPPRRAHPAGRTFVAWPRPHLVDHASDAPSEGTRKADGSLRTEFDLPSTDAASDRAQRLVDAGILEVIEPGEEVVGMALTLHPDDRSAVRLLTRSCDIDDSILDEKICEILHDLLSARPQVVTP
jgi:hypothetical protein